MTESTDPNLKTVQLLQTQLDSVLFGQQELTQLVLAGFLAGGHVLLEGLPGLGKTVLAKALAQLTGLDFKRIQFTPDLLPSDITGSPVLDRSGDNHGLRFVPGPLFSHFVLADEINRASPKTQAAMLEAMAEAAVTQMGETRPLEQPFFVIATQNPIEMEGTNPLPEAQLDRFAMKIDVPPVNEAVLLRVLSERPQGDPDSLAPIMDRDAVLAARSAVQTVFLPEAIATVIARLVSRTGEQAGNNEDIRFGSSPRGALWLGRVTRALAWMDGRDAVGFNDLARAVVPVLAHRLVLHYSARIDGISSAYRITTLYQQVEKEVLQG